MLHGSPGLIGPPGPCCSRSLLILLAGGSSCSERYLFHSLVALDTWAVAYQCLLYIVLHHGNDGSEQGGGLFVTTIFILTTHDAMTDCEAVSWLELVPCDERSYLEDVWDMLENAAAWTVEVMFG